MLLIYSLEYSRHATTQRIYEVGSLICRFSVKKKEIFSRRPRVAKECRNQAENIINGKMVYFCIKTILQKNQFRKIIF